MDKNVNEILYNALRQKEAEEEEEKRRMKDYTHIVEGLRNMAEIGRVFERSESVELWEQAANAIEELCETNGELCRIVESSFEVIRCAEEMVIRLAEAWIPVTEMLPEEDVPVLVTRKFLGINWSKGDWNEHIPPSTYVEIARRIDDEWVADSDEYKIAKSKHTDPIAWIPLPEPYERKEE